MKKTYLMGIVGMSLLLASCGKKPVVVQPIPDITQQYNVIETSVPILDAIIDTEAEVQYLQKIQREYEQLANYYDSHASKSSVLMPSSNATTVATMKEGLQDLVEKIDYFKNRINTIGLPSDYRMALNEALNAYTESLHSEKERLLESSTSTSQPSSELYQKAQEANKKVQKAFQLLIPS